MCVRTRHLQRLSVKMYQLKWQRMMPQLTMWKTVNVHWAIVCSVLSYY